jgi:two-component system sensor histidine kinase CssS
MLKRISLMKQLLLIMIVISVVFALILIPWIDYNLNSIVDNQMYDTLYEGQNDIISFNYMMNDKKTKAVRHILYDSSESNFTTVYDDTLYLYQNVFGSDLQNLILSNEDTIHSKKKANDKTYYYLITKIDNTQYLISFTTSDYSQDLVDSLKKQVIYIQYAFFVLIACILALWVVGLINPLKKIKNYIDAIKNNEDSELNIDRDDEIGIVSKALVEMKKELELQESIKEEMIHNISHDLKTPISLIKTYSQSVKDDIYPYGDKDSSMDVILENADRLDHKVKSFLYLNRLDYLNGETKETKPFEIKETIEKTTNQLSLVHPEIKIELFLDDVCFIGDEEHWRVAIENIVENASRYTKSLIRITLKENYLEIFNDGDPIDEDKMEYLFKPYVRGVKGQFGLGLSIVEKTAKMYGYSVNAYNLENGVSFVFKK